MKKNKLLYSRQQVMVSSILASPFAGGVMVRRNLIISERKKAGNVIFLVSVLVTALIFAAVMFFGSTAHYAGIMMLAVSMIKVLDDSHKKEVNEHAAAGGKFYSWDRVIMISVITAGICYLCFKLFIPQTV